MAEDDVNPIQMDEVEILNPEDRMFKSWGSVEVRDRENDLLPMSEFRKIMPVIMIRGGVLMDRHSNRQVGKILNFEFKEKETSEGIIPGVMITGEIFRDYEHDDMVWEGIKNGIYKGLSFGGRNKMKDVKFDESGLTNILTKLEGFEFSLVPGMGNQEATMEQVNFLAKSNKNKLYKSSGDMTFEIGKVNQEELEEENEKIRENKKKPDAFADHKFKAAKFTHPNGHPRCLVCGDEERTGGECEGIKKDDIKKPFAGYDDFDDCVSKNQDKGDPKAFCAVIMRKVEEANKQYSDDEDKKKALIEKDSSLSQPSDKSDKYINKKDLNKSMEADEIKKIGEMAEKNYNDITDIKKTLENIYELLIIKKQEEEVW